MANGHITGKVVQMPLVEYLGYEPHLFVNTQSLAIRGSYTGALLPAVLEGEEAEESETGCILARSVNAYDATLLARALAR
jgi:hypothetical protein